MPVADVDRAVAAAPAQRAAALTRLPEDQWFDRKSARVSPMKLAETLGAFANADGGVVVVGLDDGEVEDVRDDPKRLNDQRQAAMDHLDPGLLAKAQEVEAIDGQGNTKNLLVIRVESSGRVHKTKKGVTFLRVGDESRRLSGEQVRELEYDKGFSSFETSPVLGTDIEAELDGRSLNAYRRRIAARTEPLTVLADRTGATPDNVTVAAVLLFWKMPERYFPNAVLRVSRYEGTTRRTGRSQNLRFDEMLYGPIPRLAMAAQEVVRRVQPTRRALGPDGVFADIPTVPEDAWLEGIVNALIHRSYSLAGDHIHVDIFDDRIEIFSPGRFPHIVHIEDPLSIRRYARNPRIVRVCYDLRICQELGEGIRRMFDEMRSAGLVDPLYTQDDAGVTLTLAARPVNEALDQRFPQGIREILGALRRSGRLSTAEIVEALDESGVSLSRPAVRSRLNALREAKEIAWYGKSAKDPRAYWYIPEESRVGTP